MDKQSLNFAEAKYKKFKILIFGLGVNQGGLGAAKFFVDQGAEVRITDLKTADELKVSLDKLKVFKDVTYTLGEHKEEDFDWADLIIKNPGVKPGNKYLEYAKLKGKRIEMDMGILLDFISPSQVIGVTGTKGKSTTSSLIYTALKEAGENVVYAGNIGKSVLDIIPFVKENTLVVLEISSFQLEGWDVKKLSPKYAVITNILPDHLNYYQNMMQYAEAKRVIAKYQTTGDYLFINISDHITNSPKFLKGLKGKLTYFSAADLPDDFKPTLAGFHNKVNYAAALAVAKQLGLNTKEALDSMNKFKGVDFRLQVIKEWGNIKIINDTAATGPDAGAVALDAYPNSVLIAGGQNANMPYEKFAEAIENGAKAVFFLEGDATEEIKELIQNKDLIKGTYNNFDELLQDVKDFAKSGDVILFSPGAKSFNLFQNEFDRGHKFNAAVERFFK